MQSESPLLLISDEHEPPGAALITSERGNRRRGGAPPVFIDLVFSSESESMNKMGSDLIKSGPNWADGGSKMIPLSRK